MKMLEVGRFDANSIEAEISLFKMNASFYIYVFNGVLQYVNVDVIIYKF